MGFIGSVKEYFRETGEINGRRLKKFVLAAPFWILIAAVGLTATGIIRYSVVSRYTDDGKTASVWGQNSEIGYRHLSVYSRGGRSLGTTTPSLYISPELSLGRTDILEMRKALQNVVDAGNGQTGAKSGLSEDGRPKGWEDCFSTFLDQDVYHTTEAGQNDSVEAEIIAVEGNYRAFHLFKYMSGGFLPEIGVDADQVVINDVMAWRFFRSYDVVGNRINIFGQDFTITGVVAEHTDGISRSTGSERARAYIYFRTLENLVLRSSDEDHGESSQLSILTYEAMLPEQVTGVALTDFRNSIPNYNNASPQFYVVSNTGRYTPLSIWKNMMPIGETETFLKDYDLPYWENAAQLATQHLFADMVLVAAGAVLLLIGTVTAVLRWKKPIV